jgi:hypothetical protein
MPPSKVSEPFDVRVENAAKCRLIALVKEATLARVRNNQRKSRAKRQEYIASLERKLRDYETGKVPLDVESQSTLRRLERENRRLKSLLGAAGLPQIWMDAYLKLDSESDTSPKSPVRGNLVSASEFPSEASQSSSASEQALDISDDCIDTGNRWLILYLTYLLKACLVVMRTFLTC